MSNELSTNDGKYLTLSRQNSAVPAFMQGEDQHEGVDLLKNYIRPPRMKVFQSNMNETYSTVFNPGDVGITPQNLKLAEVDEPFYFVPLLFYPEYCVVNPLQMKGTLPMIREQTFDVQSNIAMRARDPNLREDVCPENKDYKIRYVEYLTYMVLIIQRPELAGIPIAMSFSRAEHKVGAQLASLIKMRQAPIYGCVFEGMVPKKKRSNAKGNWFGLDVNNPHQEGAPPAFVPTAEEFQILQSLHRDLKSKYESQSITIDHSDDFDYDEDTGDVTEADAKF